VQAFEARPPPLTEDAGGVLRVVGTRVRLDTIVTAFDRGATAEEIVDRYPTLDIASVYEVIAYLLRNRATVDDYMARQREKAAKLQAEIEERFPPHGIRARLLARRDRGESR
jgi:uncharacterized protein (DUF433 family)